MKRETDTALSAQREDAMFRERHRENVERAAEGKIDLLFLGDSITQRWDKKVWEEYYGEMNAANFGIDGDRTENLLWRITDGKELAGISPEIVVLLIGVNNVVWDDAKEIENGIRAIVRVIHGKLPESRILLLGVFPAGPGPGPAREKIRKVNAGISRLDKREYVRFLDIGDRFLDKEQKISPNIMPDYLHLSAKGYRIWAGAMAPVLTEMMGRDDSGKKTGLVYHEAFLAHKTGKGHPESPERLRTVIRTLKEKKIWDKLVKISPASASESWITRIHTPEYIERVRKACTGEMKFLDSIDVPICAESYEAAVLAAGAGPAAADAIMDNRIGRAFCLVRPPGHHAMPETAMGFCIFNNIAITARYIQKKCGLKKILIIDWDVHHGNGTEAVFYDDPSVLHFGIHQHPFYPGTGTAEKKGRGKGAGLNINVPLPAGSGMEEYRKAFREKLIPAAAEFEPDFVLISAGFDAHKNDPLAGITLSARDYGELTQIVREIADRHCKGRIVSFLEGGYNLEALAASVKAHIRALMEKGEDLRERSSATGSDPCKI